MDTGKPITIEHIYVNGCKCKINSTITTEELVGFDDKTYLCASGEEPNKDNEITSIDRLKEMLLEMVRR